MTPRSLRVRLMCLAAAVISIVLVASGLLFYWLFQRHVEQFVMAELTSHFEQLAAGLSVAPDGQVVAEDTRMDSRFQVPGGGLYWQADTDGQSSLRSRSLWDTQLTVPTPPEDPEEDHAHVMHLPFGGEIFALEKLVTLEGENGAEKRIVVTIGLDRERVTQAANSFAREIIAGLAAVYVALLVGSLAMIMLGLEPLRRLRNAVAHARNRDTPLDAHSFPAEVAPLVDEINALTRARQTQLESARKRAGNLAHGLKTPLTVLSTIATELDGLKQTEPANAIRENTRQMRDLVDRELARSRMADGTHSYRAPLGPTIERVVKTMKRAPRGEDLTWSVDVPDSAFVSVDATDLLELVGNLADNARKYAHTMVRISHDGKTLVIEDDGPGVVDHMIERMMARGVRLDEAAPTGDGQGIGMSIVKDLAEVYQLDLVAGRSAMGGLSIQIALPIAEGVA